MNPRPNLPPRASWLRALCAHPRQAPIEAAERLAEPFAVVDRALPQAGLGLLRMRDGALGEEFYLGEIPVSRAHVELRDAAGERHQGAAQLLADDAGLARALAVCDALLAARLAGWEELAALVEEGLRRCEEEARRRAAMLARTRVDFSLLSQAEAGDE